VKRHLGACLAHAHAFAVPVNPHGQVQTPVVPSLTQLVGRDRHGAEGSGGFALQEAEIFGEFIWDQAAQRHVIGEHDQANAFQRCIRGGLHRHVARDDRDLGLEVDAVVF
jgi:hypothetical protein